MINPTHSINPLSIAKSFWSSRSLIWLMSKREVIGRYRGSFLGLGWSFLNPLLMLAVYTFFFSVVFEARWGGLTGESKFDFAVILFSGLILHALFSECLMRAPALILSNTVYVKKMNFPIEILPWIAMGSAIFHFVVSFGVLLLAYGLIHFTLQWTIIFFPLILLPFILLIIGFSWFLASLGVYLRDIAQTMGLITTSLLFLSPVFYPLTVMPEKYRPVFYLNPLTFIIEQTRGIVLNGEIPDWKGLGVYLCCSLIISWLGFSWFQKTRKGFADVL
jgi:lipopolysaccharide transport system permease protein